MKLSFFKELKRRNVYRVAIAYLVTSWLILQVTDVVGPIVGVPDWFSLALLVTLSIGFVLTLIVSWLYDFTPEGIQLEKDIDRTRPRTSTGRKLDFAIIAMLGLVIVVLVLDNYVIGPGSAHQQSADHQSIAVLPFEIRGSAPDSDELIGGLHEDIIVRLAKLPSFSKVITYHSVSKYAGSELSPSSIGRQLEVAIVVIGSLQASGGRIRLNVQMLDVDEDRHLWAESYERDLNLANAFDLQSSLAQDIVTQLRGAIGETELQDINAIPTNSIEAYKEYVLGRHLFAQRAVAMAQALRHFERAAEIDPNYSDAHAGVAQSLLLLNLYGQVSRDAADEGIHSAVDKALSLNSRNGRALATLAFSASRFDGNYERSNELFLEAQKASPNAVVAYHWYSISLREQDRYDEAITNIKRAIELDPNANSPRSSLGNTLAAAGRTEEAMTILEEAHNADPTFVNFAASLGDQSVSIGRFDEGLMWYETAFDNGDRRPLAILEGNQARLNLRLTDEVRESLSNGAKVSRFPDEAVAMLSAELHFIDNEFELARQTLVDAANTSLERTTWFAYRLFLLGEAETAFEVLDQHVSPLHIGRQEAIRPADACRAAITGAVLLQVGDAELANRLLDESLLTMKAMHRVRGAGYGICDVLVYLARDEVDLATSALRDAVAVGWRHEWWLLTLPFYDQLRDQPTFEELKKNVQSEITAQRQRYLQQVET